MKKVPITIKENELLLKDLREVRGVWDLELLTLCELVKQRQPKRILEIGTCSGRTTINLAKFAPEDAIVYTLDIRKHQQRIDSSLPYYNKIKFFYGNSALFNFKKMKETAFDFIFIDGNHTKIYVASDTRIALHLVNKKGTIVWHDCNNPKGKSKKIQVGKALRRMKLKLEKIQGTRLGIKEF